MKKLKLYIETSTWNFVFAEDAPEKMALTQDFFKSLGQGSYEIYTSNVVLLEIGKAQAPIRKRLEDLIVKHQPFMLESSPEADALAQLYLELGAVPPKKLEDALHVAIATVEEMDALITWNYKHLANLKRSETFHSINITQGYWKKLEIVTPMEVMGDEVR